MSWLNKLAPLSLCLQHMPVYTIPASLCYVQLHLLGYKQELSRHLSSFHNFATTFSFLSPITGGSNPSAHATASALQQMGWQQRHTASHHYHVQGFCMVSCPCVRDGSPCFLLPLNPTASCWDSCGISLVMSCQTAGLTGTYLFLFQYGGPVSIVWGWLLVSTANFLLGLVLAEICSAYPTVRHGRPA